MLAALSSVDYGLIALLLAATLALSVYFSGRQRDTGEFFLGNRSLGWIPLGLSLLATLLGTLTVPGLAGLGYEHGLKGLIVPFTAWLIMPVVIGLVIPIFRGLGLYSLGEYLELRFDGRVRLLGSMLLAALKLLWLVAAISIAARFLRISLGWTAVADWWLIPPLGLVATLCPLLGGQRAVVWNGVLQAVAMLAGIVVLIVAVWVQLPGGPERVREVAEGLGRTQLVELHWSWTDPWTLWAALPHWAIVLLMSSVADQATGQRLLSARSVNMARTSYFASGLALSLAIPGLIYAGLCLLAFYYDHPQSLRPEWVVNIDGVTRQPIVDAAGQPLLDDANPAHEVRWENIDRLVAEDRILQPNNKQPFTQAAGLIDAETNQVLVSKIAMRRPPNERLNGEWIVRRGSPEQMLPWLVAGDLPWGVAGMVIAALLAGFMAVGSTGLHAIATLIVVDYHRRFGLGKAQLARRLNKNPEELTPADELRLARPLLLALGLTVIALGIGLSHFAGLVTIVGVASAVAAPLAAVFLLGMLTRRTSATAALVAVVLGGLFTVGLSILGLLAAADSLVPKTYAFAEVWNVTFGFVFTYAIGYLLSFVLGKRKLNVELRGLVAGCGELGVLAVDEVRPIINEPGLTRPERWQ